MEPYGSSQSSQKAATETYPKTVQFNRSLCKSK